MLTTNIELQHLADHHLVRNRRIVTTRKEKNFASNDYLGLSQDNRVKEAFIAGVTEFGFGSGSSAMISGYSRAHQELEEQFAAFLGRERALLFNSGYHANLGVVTTFADRSTTIIADKQCHASIIDAITLSRAKHIRFRHHDVQHANELLQQSAATLLITESVFSMTGAITHVDKIAAIVKEQRATFMIDDAHGFGILGNSGRGICEHFNLTANDVPIVITPLGKALGGMGAIVSGNHDVIELLLQKARTYCYSTAMPPAICSAALQALQLLQQERWRLVRLRELIHYFHRAAAERNLSLLATDMTPIKCLLTGSNQQTLALQEKLLTAGFLVAAIRPPTVPEDAARIRISLTATQSEADITQLLDVLSDEQT